MKKSKKFLRGIYLMIGCCIPMIFVAGCGISDTIKCTACGDSSTRVLCYASGKTDSGIEYRSCVGLSGCLGLGCDTKCLPVECLTVEANKKNENISGTVCYYNSFGCIDPETAKSHGEFEQNSSCMGCNCSGEKYVEDITDEKSEAYTQDQFMRIKCGNAENVTSEELSKKMPRQFPKGCWSCSAPEESTTPNEED